MIDKQILDDDFGGFEKNDAETFALEQLTTYPGNSEGFVVVPPPQEESLSEEPMDMSVVPDMEFTDMPLMSNSDQIDAIDDVAMDDDFIRSLQQELSNKKNSTDLVDQPEIQEQDFIEIDTDPHAEVIDLGEIKADHPSTFTWDDAQPPQQEALPDSDGFGGGYGGYAAMAQSMGTDEPIADTAPPLVEEKRNKKKGFVLPSLSKKTMLIAASVAGVTTLGIAGYMLTPVVSGLFADKHADSTAHVVAHSNAAHNEKKKEEHHQPNDNKHVDDKAITAISDSLLDEISGDAHHGVEAHHSKDTHPSAETHKKDAHDEINSHVTTDHKDAPEHHLQSVKKQDTHVNKGKTANAHEDKVSKPSKLKKNELHGDDEHEHSKNEHKSVPKDSKISKEVVKETPKTEPEKKDVQVASTTKEVKQLYTVQVYATPSKNEAERWLQKLRTTSVSSAVITTQQIRDKTWYRVRFGNFSSRDEAEKAIRTLGYDQCWIDRVR